MAQANPLPEPMVLSVGKDAVLFPRECCCCGAPADCEETLERTKKIPLGIVTLRRTVSLKVPCCAKCRHNVRWQQLDSFIERTIAFGVLMLVVSAIVSGLVGAIVEVFLHVSKTTDSVISWVAFGAVFGLWLWRRIQKNIARPIEGHICSTRSPVAIGKFDANTTTLHLRNHEFGAKTAALNAPPAAAQLAG